MNVPDDLQYAESHEWLRLDGDDGTGHHRPRAIRTLRRRLRRASGRRKKSSRRSRSASSNRSRPPATSIRRLRHDLRRERRARRIPRSSTARRSATAGSLRSRSEAGEDIEHLEKPRAVPRTDRGRRRQRRNLREMATMTNGQRSIGAPSRIGVASARPSPFLSAAHRATLLVIGHWPLVIVFCSSPRSRVPIRHRPESRGGGLRRADPPTSRTTGALRCGRRVQPSGQSQDRRNDHAFSRTEGLLLFLPRPPPP